MADFNIAVEFVLKNEGGLVNDQADPGGITNFGVTAKYLMDNNFWRFDFNGDGVIDVADMKLFTQDDAIFVYKNWWDKFNYYLLANTELAKRVFDFAVNCGQHIAIEKLQQALNFAYPETPLCVDGALENQTADKTNSIPEDAMWRFIGRFKSIRVNYYDELISNNHALAKFKVGWLKRAYE